MNPVTKHDLVCNSSGFRFFVLFLSGKEGKAFVMCKSNIWFKILRNNF